MDDSELIRAKKTLSDRKYIEAFLKTVGNPGAEEYARDTRQLRRYLELYEQSLAGTWSREMTIVRREAYFVNIRRLKRRISSYALADIEARVGFTRVELMSYCEEYGL